MDILSAALDESGITADDEPFDFDFTSPPQPTGVPQVAGQTQFTRPSNQVIVNGQPPTIIGDGRNAQQPVFSNALKSLAAQNNGTPQKIATTHAISPALTGQSAVSVLQRSASSPAIIKLPAKQGNVANIPQILRQQSAQSIVTAGSNTPGRTKIITVKRVGPNGSITQSRSFTISADAATGLAGQKLIVQRSNGGTSQVAHTTSIAPVQMQPIGSQAGGTIKIPLSVVQTTGNQSLQAKSLSVTTSGIANSFENQFKQFTQSYPAATEGKVNISVKEPIFSTNGIQDVIRTQPHIIHINRPLSTTSSTIVTKSLPQAQTHRLIPSHSVTTLGSSPSMRVIQRPFQNGPNGSPSLQHSQSMLANMANYSNIPQHLLEQRKTNSPPAVVINQSVFGNSGKSVLNNLYENGMNSVDPMSAMQRSVQNLPPPKITNKDISRMWSNQDFRLKNITQSVVNHSQTVVRQSSVVEEEEEGEEVEGLGQAETYSDYMPPKLKLGIKHPDPVVETSSMSSIEPPNIHYRLSIPESTIDHGKLSALQLESIVYASQRHEIILPSGERAGFLIGDGAGVGKGRTLAGIIFENYLLGRKRSLWLSVSNDLKVDAERDLRDIGAHKIEVHALNKFKYAKISGKDNGRVKKGVVFATYSSLIGESHSSGKYRTRFKQLVKWLGKDFDGCIVFDECHKAKNLCPTRSSKPTKTGQTVLELQKRLPKARVVYASATGASEPKNMAYMTRLGLWGDGTPFPKFSDFIQAVEGRGVGAMELVAMDMKLRGMYIARQLSFKGVSFKIEEIPIDEEFVKMYNEAVQLWVDAREMFQSAADLVDADHSLRKSMWGQFWSAHQRFFKYLCISAKVPHCVQLAREALKDGKCVVIGLQSTGEARTLKQLEEMGGELDDFVSTAKGVVQTVVENHFPAPDRKICFDIYGQGNNSVYNNEDSNSSMPGSNKRKKDQAMGNSAKRSKSEFDSDSSCDSEESELDFGLNDTSDDDDDSDDNDSFNPFGSGSDSDEDPWLKKSKAKAKAQVKSKHKEKNKEKKKKENSKAEDKQFSTALAGGDAIEKALQMKRALLDRIEFLGNKLPANTLDQLIDDLGGTDSVAEMTGRKGRVVCTDEGISFESRSENDVPLDIMNLTEKQRFMDGEKCIAIISEAASSGISLQADRRAINQKRRVHITLELPWSADRAVQQFGRTHRSNQVSAPEYLFMISELAGEQRFASSVAKRLESLGALTHGDRRATESRDLSRFNFDNKYGKLALESVMKTISGFEHPFVTLPEYKGDFFHDAVQSMVGVGMITQDRPGSVPILDKDYNNISKFLNRILGCEVTLQNALFKYFSSSLTAVILEAKRSGRWDMGIMDLGSCGASVKKLETNIFVGDEHSETSKVELGTVSVDRGMSFPSVLDIYNKYNGVDDRFYVSLKDRSVRRFAKLAVHQGALNKKKEKLYMVYRPKSGLQPRQETLDEVKKKYKKVLPEEAQRYWEEQYNFSATMCIHAYRWDKCKKVNMGLPCEIGLRTKTYYVLSGSVLSVWNKVEMVLRSKSVQTGMQIIRLRTDDNQRIVGILIPTNAVQRLCNTLSFEFIKNYTKKHTGDQEFPRAQEDPTPSAVYSMPMFV